MSSENEKSIVSNHDTFRLSKPLPQGGVWDVLEKMARNLEQSRHGTEQMACVLQAIRACIHADAVFKISTLQDVPVELSANRSLSREWCRDFARQQLSDLPSNRGSHCALAAMQESPLHPNLHPQSTAMVRLSKSRSLWLVAVSFDPQRLFHADDLKLMAFVRRVLLDHRRHVQAHEKMTDALLEVIRGLNEAMYAKNPFFVGHSDRVARMAVRLAQQMNLSPAMQSDLHLAGLLHDVGKIGIRDSVLQKQGPLDEAEQAHMREHPIIGAQIVSKIKPLAHLRFGVRNHHERFDGQGYPDCLAGHAIPLEARILAIADCFDAMTSQRPYRDRFSAAAVNEIMAAGAGKQWDPLLIAHFMACRNDLVGILDQANGEPVLQTLQDVARDPA